MSQVKLIEGVLNKLNENKVNYCVLRDYDFLLDNSKQVVSLDILVSGNQKEIIDKLLINLGFRTRRGKYSLPSKVQRAYFNLSDDLKKVSFTFHFGGIHWNDILYLEDSVLDNKKMLHKGGSYFYVPSNNDSFVVALLYSIFSRRGFKRYQELLSSIEIDEGRVLKKISKVFSSKSSKDLYKKVREGRFKQINNSDLISEFIFSCSKELANVPKFITLMSFALRYMFWKKPFTLPPLICVSKTEKDVENEGVLFNEEIKQHLRNNRIDSIIINYDKKKFFPSLTHFFKLFSNLINKKVVITNKPNKWLSSIKVKKLNEENGKGKGVKEKSRDNNYEDNSIRWLLNEILGKWYHLPKILLNKLR